MAAVQTAMLAGLPRMAAAIDKGADGTAAESNLAMQAGAFVNLLDAGRAQGIRTDLLEPVGALLERGVAAGLGAADLAALEPTAGGDG